MKNVLIIGASRGIGLSLAKEAINLGFNVICTCRELTENLKAIKCTLIKNIDMQDPKFG